MRIEGVLEKRLSTINPIVLVNLLQDKGFGLSKILASTQINQELLKSPDNQITFGQYRQLISNSLTLSDNPALGLEFGKRLNFSGSGVIGMGAMAAKTFYQALLFCGRAAEVINPAIALEINERDDLLCVDVVEQLPWEETQPFMVDTLFSIIVCIVNMLDPLILRKMVFKFKYPCQVEHSYYQAYLPGVLKFEAGINSLHLPLDFANKPMPSFNPHAVEQVEKILDKLVQEVRDERSVFTQPIRQMIMESNGEMITSEEVARRFHVSSRTLNRRLKSLGTSFSEIIVEVRYSIACDLLSNSSESMDQIAYRLGYRDASNFSKAFKGWSGVTPSQFRDESTGNQ
ncbi:MAG: helix-turn-helix domain-containing protein [Candidatus Thiodiazotropha sp.]